MADEACVYACSGTEDVMRSTEVRSKQMGLIEMFLLVSFLAQTKPPAGTFGAGKGCQSEHAE